MLLLDILVEPRRIDTARVITKPIIRDTVSVPADTTDTVATTVNVLGGNQQLADIAPHPSGILGMVGDHLLWTIIVVLVALCLCFYFVRKYRKTNA
jgi:hypothetical protein